MGNVERKRRFDDRASEMSGAITSAEQKIDWTRRKNAEKSFYEWMKTYGIGIWLEYEPCENMRTVMSDMEKAVLTGKNVNLNLFRGCGKSSVTLGLVCYLISKGIKDFIMILSASARASSTMLSDVYRITSSEKWCQDYPKLALPFLECHGSFRRRLLWNGRPISLSKTAQSLQFPEYQREDGSFEGGQIVISSSITSGIRPLSRRGNKRVSLVILDDVQQGEDMASNQETVQKYLSIIHKDVMGLAGKDNLTILFLGTPIVEDDLVAKLRKDVNFKSISYPAVISFPKNEEIWKTFYDKYEKELIDNAETHDESYAFYREHQTELEDGCKVFDEKKFNPLEFVSAIQKFMLVRKVIGNEAFSSEYQLQPVKSEFAINVTPQMVSLQTNGLHVNEIESGFVYTIASMDINPSYGLTISVVNFKPDTTTHVVNHWIHKCHILGTSTDLEFNQKLYAELTKAIDEISDLPIKVDSVCIDGSGRQFSVVTEFSKKCKLPCVAMLGRSSTKFSPFVKSRLRSASGNGRCVLCGDESEHQKSGSGKKWIYWDADFYKLSVLRKFVASNGSEGSISLYDSDSAVRTDFCTQVCNERLKGVHTLPNGMEIYSWQTKDPHDYLDTLAQAIALSEHENITSVEVQGTSSREKYVNLIKRMRQTKKYRFV